MQKSQNSNFRDIFKWRLNRSAAARTLRGSQPVAVASCHITPVGGRQNCLKTRRVGLRWNVDVFYIRLHTEHLELRTALSD